MSTATNRNTNDGSSSFETAAAPSRRKKAWPVLVGMLMVTNAFSTMTWSVFHVYFQTNNSTSSSIMSAISEESFSRMTTVVTSTSGSYSADASKEAVAKSQELPTSSSYLLLKPLNVSSQQLLYKRIENHFISRYHKFEPYQNLGTCTHRNIAQENKNQSTIDYVACCGLGHRLGRMSAASLVASKLKAHLYGFWGCCDEIEVFSYLFGDEPIVLYADESNHDNNQESMAAPSQRKATVFRGTANAAAMDMTDVMATSASNTTATPFPIHLQFRNEVAGFGGGPSKCDATDEKVKSDFAFYSTLREHYTNKHVVDKFVQQHFTNETLSIAIHIRAGNGETGDFAKKKRQIDDSAAFVRNTADMIREIVAQNKATTSMSSSPSQKQQLSPLVFIATDTRSYMDAFRKELASSTSTSPIPVVTLPAQIHAAEGRGVMFGVANKVMHSGEKCLDGWRNVVEDMLVLSHADVVFAPSYSSFTQTIPISLSLGRNKDAHGESKSHIAAPFCDVVEGKLSCYETFQQWHCNTHPPKTVTHKDVEKSWRDVLLPVS